MRGKHVSVSDSDAERTSTGRASRYQRVQRRVPAAGPPAEQSRSARYCPRRNPAASRRWRQHARDRRKRRALLGARVSANRPHRRQPGRQAQRDDARIAIHQRTHADLTIAARSGRPARVSHRVRDKDSHSPGLNEHLSDRQMVAASRSRCRSSRPCPAQTWLWRSPAARSSPAGVCWGIGTRANEVGVSSAALRDDSSKRRALQRSRPIPLIGFPRRPQTA